MAENQLLRDHEGTSSVVYSEHSCAIARGIQIGRSQQLFITQTEVFNVHLRELAIQESRMECLTCGAHLVVVMVVPSL